MKLKRLLKRTDAEGNFEGFRRQRLPKKRHEELDFFHPGPAKQNKAQRARHKRRLREKYGKVPETPRPTDYMSTHERHERRAEVLAAAGYQCENPHCTSTTHLTLDHVVPRHIGGGNHRENLQCLCADCNAAKGLDIWKATHGTTPALFL